MIKAISIALVVLALLASGCGGALESANEACKQQCGQEFISCLEGGACVDVLTGETGPCQKECAEKRATCEQGCG
jgi:hypothetical protein